MVLGWDACALWENQVEIVKWPETPSVWLLSMDGCSNTSSLRHTRSNAPYRLRFPPHAPLPLSQEFGIDIASEDKKTIIHHKVAARIACVFSADDARDADAIYDKAQVHLSPPTVPSASLFLRCFVSSTHLCSIHSTFRSSFVPSLHFSHVT